MRLNIGLISKCLLASIIAANIAVTSGKVCAGIIAADDFESYTPRVGDPEPHFGNDAPNENGGYGAWTSPWVEGTTLANEMYVRSSLLPSFGQGLEVNNLGDPSDSNVITRQFQTQSDDFYVGLTMRTTIDSASGDEFLLFYLSDSTASDNNIGYGGGTLRGTAGPGNFFVRQGNNTAHTDSGITQVYGQVYNIVLKFSKSGLATDPFDGIDMWIDQGTEGTPDVSSNAGTASLANLSTFHIWFDPRGMTAPNKSQLAVDNMVIATTYEDALYLANGNPLPVPEPSSILLGLLGILGAFVIKRRYS